MFFPKAKLGDTQELEEFIADLDKALEGTWPALMPALPMGWATWAGAPLPLWLLASTSCASGGLELASGVVEPFYLSFWGGAHGCHPLLQALSAWEEVTWLNLAASVSPDEVEGTGDMKARLALAMKPNSTACRAVDVFGKMPRGL